MRPIYLLIYCSIGDGVCVCLFVWLSCLPNFLANDFGAVKPMQIHELTYLFIWYFIFRFKRFWIEFPIMRKSWQFGKRRTFESIQPLHQLDISLQILNENILAHNCWFRFIYFVCVYALLEQNRMKDKTLSVFGITSTMNFIFKLFVIQAESRSGRWHCCHHHFTCTHTHTFSRSVQIYNLICLPVDCNINFISALKSL